ncbi:MAG TPA: MFS transporter [Dehalococcoidia bacterium]|nr:MFS transporter [Dehalococcoidia bacterium]
METGTRAAGTRAVGDNKASRIRWFSFARPHMRTFHVTWFAFFLAFFGWFGIAPVMVLVRDDLGLTKTQIGNTIIASVAITILARLVIGWLCDRIGPRLAYSGLLVVGSIPVMSIGLAQNYETFLLFRLAIGVIGASFVITQYHTSIMFGPNVVGTANATTAGWGNLGGGVTQMVMPLVLAGVLMLGVSETLGWRIAMIFPGVALLLVGFAYYFLTQDSPEGNYRQLRAEGRMAHSSSVNGSFLAAARDHRVWSLFVVYGACFGIELTINNVAALYFHDRFALSIGAAGLIAGLFGLMNIFARTLGGVFGDMFGIRFGLKGRVLFMGAVLGLEGLALILFSQMASLVLAVGAMIVFSLFVQMSEGATYSVVPFINRKALGSVAGIVGAGGNAGAVAAGFLFRIEGLSTEQALLFLGIGVALVAPMALLVRFSPATEMEERRAMELALARGGLVPSGQMSPATAD